MRRTSAVLALMLALGAAAACGDDTSTGGAGQGGASQGGASSAGGATSTGGAASGGAASGGAGQGGAAAGFSSIGTSSFETQASLAADAQGDVLVTWVAVNADGSSSVGYALSRDAGASWAAPAYLPAPDGRLSTNPVVAVDSQGTFTLAWVGFRLDPQTPDEHVYLARLETSDTTFSTPVVASDDGTATDRDFDSLAIAIDANDDVLLTYANFTGFTQGFLPQLLFARSSDGASFTRTPIVSDDTFGNLAALCLDGSLGPSAPLYVVHLGAAGTLVVRRSTDGGTTWEAQPAPGAASVVFQHPTCAVDGDTVHVAYASGDAMFSPSDDSPGDAIQVVRSNDGGGSWAQPVTVTEAGADQYLFPRLAVSPDGKLEIAYYQGVVGQPATFMHASSSNGTTWTRSEILPAGTFTTDLTLASWLGGYVGLDLPGTSGFVAFAENTQNKTHIAFAEIALP